MRKLVTALFILSLCLFIKPAYADKSLYLNNLNTGQKILLIRGTSYIPTETLAARLDTYTAWFPGSNTFILNGSQIRDFINSKGAIYVSAKEAAKACGGSLKFNKRSRDLYFIADKSKVSYTRSRLSSNSQDIQTIELSSPVSSNKSLPLSSSSSSSSLDDLTTVYPQSSAKSDSTILTRHAGGTIMDGLRIPVNATISGIPAPKTQLTSYAAPYTQGTAYFSPKTAQNSTFQVTVTNMEEISVVKNRFNASAGNKYVVLYVSQQNISPEVQIYTGKFTFVDENSKVYDYLEGLSNYWLSILKPGGVNYGYLVFEIPSYARPSYLVLNALNQPPLEINLIN